MELASKHMELRDIWMATKSAWKYSVFQLSKKTFCDLIARNYQCSWQVAFSGNSKVSNQFHATDSCGTHTRLKTIDKHFVLKTVSDDKISAVVVVRYPSIYDHVCWGWIYLIQWHRNECPSQWKDEQILHAWLKSCFCREKIFFDKFITLALICVSFSQTTPLAKKVNLPLWTDKNYVDKKLRRVLNSFQPCSPSRCVVNWTAFSFPLEFEVFFLS